MSALVAMALAAALGGINFWLYSLNKKTPVPEGCENIKPECSACGIANCSLRSEFQGENK
jgi:hypothetical protein